MESRIKDCIQLGKPNRSTSRQKVISLHKENAVQKPNLFVQKLQYSNINKPINYQQNTGRLSVFSPLNHQNLSNIQENRLPEQKVLIKNIQSRQQYQQNIRSPITQRIYINSKQNKLQLSKQKMTANHMIYLKISQEKAPIAPKTVRRNLQTVVQPLSAVDQKEAGLMRKIKTLQIRISQISNQKMNMECTLREQNRRLFHENQYLKNKINQDKVQQIKAHVTELQQMLQNQINKSLQLLEQNQNFKKQLQEKQSQLFNKDTLYQTVSKQLKALQQKKKQLENQFINCNQTYTKQIQTIKTKFQQQFTQIHSSKQITQSQKVILLDKLQEKDQLITDLTEKNNKQILQMTKIINEYKLKMQQLQTNLQRSNIMTNSATSWKTDGFELRNEDKKQCKKCQDLLKTIFKLNTHLNKKQK